MKWDIVYFPQTFNPTVAYFKLNTYSAITFKSAIGRAKSLLTFVRVNYFASASEEHAMRILVVFDHPRRDSFCGAILDSFTRGLTEAGHTFEVADLYREGFDPRMSIKDEPDWSNPNKTYSNEVLREQKRVNSHDGIAVIFPVWWWSLPAMSKGWIDRVWNNGWAYGAQKLTHKKAAFLAVGSGTADGYAKREYDRAMRISLQQGILNYCGIEGAKLEFLLESLGSEEVRNKLIIQARNLGYGF